MRYETWVLERLRLRPRCRVEGSMTCIPLRGDPICMACFYSDLEMEATESHEQKD